MRLVLVGPPASGKGTQADRLTVRFGVPKISTGDMLRAARAAGTRLGKEAETYMNAGKLVPDEVVIGLVDERLDQDDAREGFILDGFPRTVPQAEALGGLLAKRGTPLQCVLQIDVSRDLLLERATLRRIDKRSGQIYHLKYNPPPPDAELEHRADDQEETVKRRLDEYDAMTAALLPFYEKLGLLRRIDGVGTPDEVTARIERALER
ncbi:MAG: adenylate kinase [Polyangiaceae bacterium]|nr:adenylate kinase [Polyangiaceae bacterium]MCL4752768.1 adenylate kinase [Myxococcales bacterium]